MSKPKGEVSDGYHTFNELYEHRALLFAALFNTGDHPCAKSQYDSLGRKMKDWFLVYVELPTGQISYHLEMKHWDLFVGNEVESIKDYDGHNSSDVVDRLKKYSKLNVK